MCIVHLCIVHRRTSPSSLRLFGHRLQWHEGERALRCGHLGMLPRLRRLRHVCGAVSKGALVALRAIAALDEELAEPCLGIGRRSPGHTRRHGRTRRGRRRRSTRRDGPIAATLGRRRRRLYERFERVDCRARERVRRRDELQKRSVGASWRARVSS